MMNEASKHWTTCATAPADINGSIWRPLVVNDVYAVHKLYMSLANITNVNVSILTIITILTLLDCKISQELHLVWYCTENYRLQVGQTLVKHELANRTCCFMI